MGGVCSSSFGQDTDPIVDVEKLLIDYAWTELSGASWLDRRLKSRRFDIKLNPSFLNIDHKIADLVFSEKPDIQNAEEKEIATQSVSRELLKKQADKLGKAGPGTLQSKLPQRDLHLFSTRFDNSTQQEQTFTFKTDKQTKAVLNVSVQKGFQLNGKLDLNIKVPKSISITGGISTQRQVTNIEGETYEEAESWGIDTQIKVQRETTCCAAVIVCEERMDANFTVESSIHCNQDIPVYVINKKTKVKHILLIPAVKLCDILSEDLGFVKVEKNHVTFTSKGTYRATYGAQQKISVEYEPLLTKPEAGTSTKSAGGAAAVKDDGGEKSLEAAAGKEDEDSSDDEEVDKKQEVMELVPILKK